MKVNVQFIDLNEQLRSEIASHIQANWANVTIDNGSQEPRTQRVGTPQALLVICAMRPAAGKLTAPLRETIVVDGVSAEEVLFLVDAKLGRLTKSDIPGIERKVPINSAMSRREFLLGAFGKSTRPNDAPVVLANSCEARFGCRKCVDACPAPGALKIEAQSVVVSSELCIRCGLFAGICPVAAIQVPGFSEDAYRGLLAAIQSSPAPTKTLVITCDEQCIRQRSLMDIEQVPGIGLMGVRQLAMAVDSSISETIVYCPDGLCAGKENAKRAANLISSLVNEATPVVSYVEGKDGETRIDRIHNSARKREGKLGQTTSPWRDYVNSIKSVSANGLRATGLGFTDIQVADSCTLCNACAESCPHHVLSIEDGELAFREAECTGCGYCEQICPEHSITLTEMDGPTMLITRTVYKDRMINCAKCNTPFVSTKMLSKVSQTLQADESTMRLCPSCRQAQIYETIFGNTNDSSNNT
jgi:Fe-S-cluster-containing hydrogenase component 2